MFRILQQRVGNKKGMTLLETLISLILFAFIAIFLISTEKATRKYQKKLSDRVLSMKLKRNVFQIIRSDIQNMFYTVDTNALAHVDYLKKEKGLLYRIETADLDANLIDSEVEDFERMEVNSYMHSFVAVAGGFEGKKDEMRLTSFSYKRFYENEKAGDQNIVVYYLKPCKSAVTRQKKDSCLWRKFSSFSNQDSDNLKDFSEFVLLEGVKRFELSYYNLYSNEWLSEWQTHPQDRNFLPAAVHIKIESEDKKSLPTGEIKAPLYHQFILPFKGSK